MSEYTKGEWKVSNKLPNIIARITPPYQLRGKTTVSCGNETGGQSWPTIDIEEQEANARLIAAAPDLLAACEEAHRVSERIKNYLTGDSCSDVGLYDLDEIIKAAIAKAEK